MAIRRVGASRKRHATRTANPAKRRARKATPKKSTVRNGTTVRRKRRRRANPASKRRRNPPIGAYRGLARNPKRRRRNPSSSSKKGMLVVAGVDMGLVALGTVSAVVVKNGLNSVPGLSDLIAKLPASLQPLASPALTVGAGWAIHKYAKNPTLKKIGAYTAVAALVLAVDDFAQKYMSDMFKSGTGGAYHNYGGAYMALSGAHMHTGTGGAYVALPNPGRRIGSGGLFSGSHALA